MFQLKKTHTCVGHQNFSKDSPSSFTDMPTWHWVTDCISMIIYCAALKCKKQFKATVSWNALINATKLCSVHIIASTAISSSVHKLYIYGLAVITNCCTSLYACINTRTYRHTNGAALIRRVFNLFSRRAVKEWAVNNLKQIQWMNFNVITILCYYWLKHWQRLV